MKDFTAKIWQKYIQEAIEQDSKKLGRLKRIRIQEEVTKQEERMKKISKDIESMDKKELVQLIYSLESKIESQERQINAMTPDVEALDKIKGIIDDADEYWEE